MSSQNVELVHRVYEAYAGRDIESLLELLDPDVELRSLLTEAERPVYRGHDGVREWMAAVFEVFPDWSPVIQRAQELDDGVVVAFHVTATSAGTRVPIAQDFWAASRLRDGKVVWFGFFRTEGEAHEALRAAA
jgi:ketosteroid isomerase-like protein